MNLLKPQRKRPLSIYTLFPDSHYRVACTVHVEKWDKVPKIYHTLYMVKGGCFYKLYSHKNKNWCRRCPPKDTKKLSSMG